jgi:hypothetical protein
LNKKRAFLLLSALERDHDPRAPLSHTEAAAEVIASVKASSPSSWHAARIAPPPKLIGAWRLGPRLSLPSLTPRFYENYYIRIFAKRPRRLTRFLAKWLLEMYWLDADKDGFVRD